MQYISKYILLYEKLPNVNKVFKNNMWDFPGGPVVKTSPSKVGDVSSIPGLGS